MVVIVAVSKFRKETDFWLENMSDYKLFYIEALINLQKSS